MARISGHILLSFITLIPSATISSEHWREDLPEQRPATPTRLARVNALFASSQVNQSDSVQRPCTKHPASNARYTDAIDPRTWGFYLS